MPFLFTFQIFEFMFFVQCLNDSNFFLLFNRNHGQALNWLKPVMISKKVLITRFHLSEFSPLDWQNWRRISSRKLKIIKIPLCIIHKTFVYFIWGNLPKRQAQNSFMNALPFGPYKNECIPNEFPIWSLSILECTLL